MIKPKKLRKGARIGFVSPSDVIRDSKYPFVEKAIRKINELGYEVVWGEHARSVDRYGISAGEPHERAADINGFFADESIDAVWCVSGGNTANEVLGHLDYGMIREHPKPFIGLSDNTVVLSAINALAGLIVFHGTDPKIGSGYFDDAYTHKELVNRLERGMTGEIPKVGEWKTVRGGKTSGRLVGGNLTCMQKLSGTDYLYDFDASYCCLRIMS